MPDNDVNTQTQPVTPPVAAGPSAAELQAQLDELKRQSEGRLRDLQAERQKRQELEERLASPASPAVQAPAQVDELGNLINPYIAPVMKEVKESKEFIQQYHEDKAMQHLASKTGKTVEAISQDVALQERLIAVARKWNLRGNSYDVATKAYELMELEDLRNKELERSRQAQASSNASIPSGQPPAPINARTYSAEDFNNLPVREFDALSRSGDFRKNPDGTFTLIPRA